MPTAQLQQTVSDACTVKYFTSQLIGRTPSGTCTYISSCTCCVNNNVTFYNWNVILLW